MEASTNRNATNMSLIVAFFDNVSSYFRSKRIIGTF